MTYGVKIYKNGKKTGYLKFNTGKVIYLNAEEQTGFDQWVHSRVNVEGDKSSDPEGSEGVSDV